MMKFRHLLFALLLTTSGFALWVGTGCGLTGDNTGTAASLPAEENPDANAAGNTGRSIGGNVSEPTVPGDENERRNLAEAAGMVAAHRSLNLPLVADPDSAENKAILQHMLFAILSYPEGRDAEVESVVPPAVVHASADEAAFPDSGGVVVIPGTLSGHFSVDNKGTANYDLTLPVPPGVNGMGPGLALCYNSENGGGEMGMGWSVSTGSTSIVRGRNFLARHGRARGTSFDDEDHFYLSGKVMVCVGGTPCKPGSVYRTEVDSFVTIAASGSSGDIDSFLVTAKDGRRDTYGRLGEGVDALQCGERLDPALPEIPYSYALKRVEDLHGNFIEYQYENPNPGETLLSTITYGPAGDSTAGRFAIHFVYSGCEGSSWVTCKRRFQSRHRLDRITVTQVADGSLLAAYDFSYRQDEETGVTLLVAVRESASNGREIQSLRPTTFHWSAYTNRCVEKEIDDPEDRSPRGDDGRPGKSSSSAKSDASTPAAPPIRCSFGDFNGDGKMDFLRFHGTHLMVLLSNGEGFDKAVDWGNSKVGPSHFFEVCDVNGDGLQDLVFGMSHKGKWAGSRGVLYAMISNGSGFTGLDGTPVPTMVWNAGEEGDNPVDPDTARNATRYGEILIDKLDREGFLRRISIGDFDGDGRSDILVHRYDGRFSVRYSRGNSFGPVVTSAVSMGDPVRVRIASNGRHTVLGRLSICPIVGDENDDGMDDYKWGELADTERTPGLPPDLSVDLWLSTLSKGDSFTEPDSIPPPPGEPEDYQPIPADKQGSTVIRDLDLNGDGRQDSVEYTGRYSENPVLKKIWLNTGGKAGLLVGITDGNGAKTEIRYKQISDPSVYTPDATDNPSTATVEGVAYPIRELRSPRYVVAGVYKDECNDLEGVSRFGNFGDPVYDANGRKVREVYAVRYHYSGARTDFSGRGFLGFHSFLTLDCQTNLVKYQFLTQAFPMTGLVAREQTYCVLAAKRDSAGRVTSLDLGLLRTKDNAVTFDMVKDPVTGTRWGTLFPFMASSLESRFEYTASPVFPHVCATQPLFGRKPPSDAYSRVSAIVWFDEQDFPASPKTLPRPPEAVPVGTAPATSATGVADHPDFAEWVGKYRLDAPCRLTYGNIHRTLLGYADGNKVDDISEFWAPGPENGGLTGLVKRRQKIVRTPDYPARTGGPVTCYTFTKTGEVASKTVDCSSTDATRHFVAVADPNPALTTTETYEYSDAGLLRQTLLAGPSEGDYDVGGTHVVSKVTAWDPTGRFAAVEENALGHVSTGSWDAWGRKIEEGDCNGRHYEVEYDIAGRRTRITNTLTGWYENTVCGFSGEGETTQTVALPPQASADWLKQSSFFYTRKEDCWGDSETTYYDRKWRTIRTIKEEDGKRTLTDTIYLRDGDVAAQSEPYTHGEAIRWTVTEYDELGRVAKVVKPDGSVTINTYSGLVSLVETRGPGDAKGGTTVSLKNAKGKVIGTWNPGNAPKSWTTTSVDGKATETVKYDGFDLPRESGILTGGFLGLLSVCTASYDTLGRQILLFIPGQGRTTRVFDALGRLHRLTAPDGTVTVTTYDVMNRKIRQTVQKPQESGIETTDWYYFDTVDDEAKHLVAGGEGGWIGSVQREAVTTTGPDGASTGTVRTTRYTYDNYGQAHKVPPAAEGKE